MIVQQANTNNFFAPFSRVYCYFIYSKHHFTTIYALDYNTVPITKYIWQFAFTGYFIYFFALSIYPFLNFLYFIIFNIIYINNIWKT